MDHDLYLRERLRDMRGTRSISTDGLCPFITSMLLTLLLAGLVAGMIYLSRSAAPAGTADGGSYQSAQADIERLLSLRSTVRGVFPYLVLVVDIFLILVYLASVIAEAL